MKKIRWLIYTVVIGLIPFILRFFIWWITKNNHSIDYVINEVDIVMFGLVLNLSIITELENEKDLEPKWRTKCNGFSVIMLILFSVFLGVSYFGDVTASDAIGTDKLKILCTVLSIMSFFFCLSVYNRLSAIEEGRTS